MYSKIKKLCKTHGVSVNELEKTLNFPRGSICKWDVHSPSVIKVKMVADYFEISLDAFMKMEV